MLRDVVCPATIVLDEDVVQRLIEYACCMLANDLDDWGEGEKRGRRISWVTIDWKAGEIDEL